MQRWFLILAVAASLFAAHLTLLPYRLVGPGWREGLVLFWQILRTPTGYFSRADLLANCVAFLGLGFLWSAAVSLDARRWWTRGLLCASAVLLLGCFSLLLELSQVWLAYRVPSRQDVIMQLYGACGGALLWLSLGFPVTRRLRALDRTLPDGLAAQDRFFLAYLALLLISYFWPLDMTLHPVEIYRRLKYGVVQAIPGGGLLSGRDTWGYLFNLVAYAPVGGWAWSVMTRRSGSSASPALAWWLGVAVAAVVEGGQIFFYGRGPDIDDLLTGAVGVACGLGLASVSRGAAWEAGGRWLWCGAAVVILGVLGAIHWTAAAADWGGWEAANASRPWWERVQWIPLSGWTGGAATIFAALALWEALLLWGVLGWACGWLAAAEPENPAKTTFYVIALAVLPPLFEALQLTRPGRIADTGSALAGILSVQVGFRLAQRVRKSTRLAKKL